MEFHMEDKEKIRSLACFIGVKYFIECELCGRVDDESLYPSEYGAAGYYHSTGWVVRLDKKNYCVLCPSCVKDGGVIE